MYRTTTPTQQQPLNKTPITCYVHIFASIVVGVIFIIIWEICRRGLLKKLIVRCFDTRRRRHHEVSLEQVAIGITKPQDQISMTQDTDEGLGGSTARSEDDVTEPLLSQDNAEKTGKDMLKHNVFSKCRHRCY